MRAHISDIVVGDRLTSDVFNQYGIPILTSGIHINSEDISSLFRHRIDYVEIAVRSDSNIQTVSNNRQASNETDNNNPTLSERIERIVPMFENAVAGMKRMFERVYTEGKIDDKETNQTFMPLIDQVKSETDVVSLLLSLNSKDEYTYQHCVQVGMISYYIARWMGMSEEDVYLVGKAGYLHDIGKGKISSEILNKPSRLSDEEFASIKKHPVLGYEIINDSIGKSVISLVALQHHERLNGKGYPFGITQTQIHPMSKIVAVADVYSAMTSNRSYQKERDLLVVLKELHNLCFEELDPLPTQTFIKGMIPNFIGKTVTFQNDEQGTIIMTNPMNYFRPLVKIGNRFLDLAIETKHEIKAIQM